MPSNEKIEQLFDNIAPNYDRLNHIMSFGVDRGWRRKAVKKIVETAPTRVLDLATGTGDFAIAIAKKLGDGGSVVGVDLSEGMLAVGREKVAAAGLSQRVELRQGNAEALTFPEGSFDVVSVAFGVRNYENLHCGLREGWRMLRSGGRMVILELSSPDRQPWLWCYKQYSLKFLPWIGGLISGNRGAYRYLPESILRFPKPDKFLPMLQEAGFDECRVYNYTFGVCRIYVAEKN